jgi:hypothetical protein
MNKKTYKVVIATILSPFSLVVMGGNSTVITTPDFQATGYTATGGNSGSNVPLLLQEQKKTIGEKK